MPQTAELIADLATFRHALIAVLPHTSDDDVDPTLVGVVIEAGEVWTTDRMAVVTDTFDAAEVTGTFRAYLSPRAVKDILARHRGQPTITLTVGDGVVRVTTGAGGVTDYPNLLPYEYDRLPVNVLRRSLWHQSWDRPAQLFDEPVPMNPRQLAKFVKASRPIGRGRRESLRMTFTAANAFETTSPGLIRVQIGDHFRALMTATRH